jgi:hypothetical protein
MGSVRATETGNREIESFWTPTKTDTAVQLRYNSSDFNNFCFKYCDPANWGEGGIFM